MINRLPKQYIDLLCKICGKIFKKSLSTFNSDKKKGVNAGKFCSRECFYKSPERSPGLGKKGKKSNAWKGGRIIERGYIMRLVNQHPYGIKKGSGLLYVREHRLIMEKHIKRYLKPNEIVHHKNGNTFDNRIGNLEIMSNAEHTKQHIKNYWASCKVKQL